MTQYIFATSLNDTMQNQNSQEIWINSSVTKEDT